MKIFTLDNEYSVVCNSEGTRSGFRHLATLCRNGQSVYKTKVCYLNRTWECYEFESVLFEVVEGYFKGAERSKYHEIVKENGGSI